MDARALEPSEKVSASRKLQRSEAAEILSGSSRVIVAKGRKVETFRVGGKVDGEVLDRMLGVTGNLRAPLVRTGETTLVGFNEEAWAAVFD